MANVVKVKQANPEDLDGPNLAPGWVAETIAIWTQFPTRRGILDLSSRNIKELPPELYRMRKLQRLFLKQNKLAVLPGELFKLDLLQEIDCSNNQLTTIENEVSLLNKLELLNLSVNQISIFPPVLFNMTQLNSINLSYNEIEELPEELGNLIFLETLILSHNKIKKLPDSFGNLNNLTHFDISSNNLTYISKDILKNNRLKVLKLNNNQLQSLPLEMGLLISLEDLQIHDNPFNQMSELIEYNLMTRETVLRYLRDTLRLDDELRKLLFTEKDSKSNTSFEFLEGEDKPVLVSVTPEKLIVFLTQVSIPDVPTYHCFEICYSYFIHPDELIKLYYLRYQMNISNDKEKNKELKRVQEIIRNRVLYGLEKFIYQFNSDSITISEKSLELFKEIIASAGNSAISLQAALSLNSGTSEGISKQVIKEVSKLKNKEEKEKKKKEKEMKKKIAQERKKLEKKDKQKKVKKEDQLGIALGLPAGVGGKPLTGPSVQLSMLHVAPSELAMQIALLNSEHFRSIPYIEFLHQRWAKGDKEKRAPRILKGIKNFNDLTNWFSTVILQQKDLKNRSKVLLHVLDVLHESVNIGDYSAVFSIASAVSNAAISRLKLTWQTLDEKHKAIFDTMNEICNSSGNYRHYRGLIANVVASGGVCVPHLALFLSDLTFMEDGNNDFVNNTDMVNLRKFRLITKTIDQIKVYQEMSFEFITPQQVIQNLIIYSEKIDAEEQYEESLKCEASNRKSAAPEFDPNYPMKKALSATVGHSTGRSNSEELPSVTLRASLCTKLSSDPQQLDDTVVQPRPPPLDHPLRNAFDANNNLINPIVNADAKMIGNKVKHPLGHSISNNIHSNIPKSIIPSFVNCAPLPPKIISNGDDLKEEKQTKEEECVEEVCEEEGEYQTNDGDNNNNDDGDNNDDDNNDDGGDDYDGGDGDGDGDSRRIDIVLDGEFADGDYEIVEVDDDYEAQDGEYVVVYEDDNGAQSEITPLIIQRSPSSYIVADKDRRTSFDDELDEIISKYS